MARGDKSKYTERQKRQAEYIEEGYEKRGASEPEAERRAWATVKLLDRRAPVRRPPGRLRKALRRCMPGVGTSRAFQSSAGSEPPPPAETAPTSHYR
jgi:hypothetical protein